MAEIETCSTCAQPKFGACQNTNCPASAGYQAAQAEKQKKAQEARWAKEKQAREKAQAKADAKARKQQKALQRKQQKALQRKQNKKSGRHVAPKKKGSFFGNLLKWIFVLFLLWVALNIFVGG